PYSAAGSAFLKLIVSRDGLHWHKVPFTNDAGQPEVFIPNGPEGANHAQNDGGYITLFSQGPLKIGNQLIFYYGSSSYGKNHSPGIRLSGGGIFRARLRPDGFVSVDHGTLTTKPLIFEADDLFINSVGPLRVELLDRKKNILASSVIDGDSLDHRVSFDGKSLRQIIGQQPVQLRFSIADNGHLYSFSCR
ncbi:MAG TPA: hypothetical protein VG722_06055, partial [Tepidisphaeraceae bacterium]|nr:hypothetical protein [Tepidisphaeraceae bacterium]